MAKFIAIFEDLTSSTRYCQTLLILLKYRVCYVVTCVCMFHPCLSHASEVDSGVFLKEGALLRNT